MGRAREQRSRGPTDWKHKHTHTHTHSTHHSPQNRESGEPFSHFRILLMPSRFSHTFWHSNNKRLREREREKENFLLTSLSADEANEISRWRWSAYQNRHKSRDVRFLDGVGVHFSQSRHKSRGGVRFFSERDFSMELEPISENEGALRVFITASKISRVLGFSKSPHLSTHHRPSPPPHSTPASAPASGSSSN